MKVLERILDGAEEGSLTVLVGRPCAGKSTALAQICGIAARQGRPAVFASWEAPPDITSPMVGDREVVIPYILGWGLSELEGWLEAQSIGRGSVVAVDYVQLVSDANEWGSLHPLRRLAENRGYRLFTGFMPHRNLRVLEDRPAPGEAVRMVAESVGAELAGANRIAIICGAGADSRTVIMWSPPAVGRVAWQTEWIKPN